MSKTINIELSRWADNNEITGAWARVLAERGSLAGAFVYAGKWYLPYNTKRPKLKAGRPIKKK